MQHTLQGLRANLTAAEAQLQAPTQQQDNLQQEKAAYLADSGKQLQQLRHQLKAATEKLKAKEKQKGHVKVKAKHSTAAGGGKGKSGSRGAPKEVQPGGGLKGKGTQQQQQLEQQQLASEGSIPHSPPRGKKRKQAPSLGESSGGGGKKPPGQAARKGAKQAAQQQGLQQQQQQQSAADGKHRLSVEDFNEGLTGKWLQLYWPDDATWWQGYCASVDMVQKKALIIYETSKSGL